MNFIVKKIFKKNLKSKNKKLIKLVIKLKLIKIK